VSHRAPNSRPGEEPLLFPVPAALVGERVDRALALLTGISRAQAARMVAEGKVRVGGSVPGTGGRRLRAGELLEVEAEVEVEAEFEEGGGPGRVEAAAGHERSSAPEATVVFVDNDLVVVDKPAGLVVHPGTGNRQGTLVQQLVRLFPDISEAGPDNERPGIVQRLDKGTSGLLVVARTPAARQGLVAQLAARSVDRRYVAVVHGALEADEGVIDAPLGRSQAERLKMAVVEGGRHARTHYWALGRSDLLLPVTLASCRLETGRTHQVRAHFAAIGHPVLGDERYSKPNQSAAARVSVPTLARPWLHGVELGFVHPVTGASMRFRSEVPPELLGVLLALGLEPPPAPAGIRATNGLR